MKHSVEVRLPFCNPSLSSLLKSFPEDYLLGNKLRPKNIFIEAMKGVVPDYILFRRDKMGYEVPESIWHDHIFNENSDQNLHCWPSSRVKLAELMLSEFNS